jgi:hypothetical protein
MRRAFASRLIKPSTSSSPLAGRALSTVMLARLIAYTPVLLLSLPSSIRRGSTPLLCDAPADVWRPDEDWALQDSIPSFTIGHGENSATFWDALAASTLALNKRSASECEARMAELSPGTYGCQPKRLDVWRRLPDGRYLGVDHGRTLIVSVSEEGRLAEGSRPQYIETNSGRIYELSAAGDLAAMEAAATPPPGVFEDESAPDAAPAKAPVFGMAGRAQTVTIGTLVLALAAESAALANGLGFNLNIGSLLVPQVSAADVQAEMMLAMNDAMSDAFFSASVVQDEIINALHDAMIL